MSDLHIGRDARTELAALELCASLEDAGIDDVLITGDGTHRGRHAELAAFERIFAPLAERLVVLPGSHDRMGDDVASALMRGSRVQTTYRSGLYVVRFDSTGRHNRWALQSHGEMGHDDLLAIGGALRSAPEGTLVVLALHHHLLPLPEDDFGERVVSLLGLPNASELRLSPPRRGGVRGPTGARGRAFLYGEMPRNRWEAPRSARGTWPPSFRR